MGSDPTLPDYLGHGLRVVFVGTAASALSAARRHYFSHPTIKFWSLLQAAGRRRPRLSQPDRIGRI